MEILPPRPARVGWMCRGSARLSPPPVEALIFLNCFRVWKFIHLFWSVKRDPEGPKRFISSNFLVLGALEKSQLIARKQNNLWHKNRIFFSRERYVFLTPFSVQLLSYPSPQSASSPYQNSESQGTGQDPTVCDLSFFETMIVVGKPAASANILLSPSSCSLGLWGFQSSVLTEKQPLGNRACLEIGIIPWDVVWTSHHIQVTKIKLPRSR